jgi:hypothetical protein
MSAMQEFHVRLCQSPAPLDGYLRCLAALMRAGREQIEALQSDMGWNAWG